MGQSGCGKTTLLMDLLLQRKMLDYNSLIICGKSLHQPEYKLLSSCLEKGYQKKRDHAIFKQGSGNVDSYINHILSKLTPLINVEMYNGSVTILDPCDLDTLRNHVCVFDDLMTDSNQSGAESYYARRRHNNVSYIYISQNYHRLPRQIIRSNANCIILFKFQTRILDIFMMTSY